MGRPAFEPTQEQREQVEIAAGSGQISHEEIAIALGIDRKTLEKHFEAELSCGAYRKRLAVIAAMYRAAEKGNVAAAKAYLEHDPSAAPTPEKPAEEPVIGKKAQADIDAKSAGEKTEWRELLPEHRTFAPASQTKQ